MIIFVTSAVILSLLAATVYLLLREASAPESVRDRAVVLLPSSVVLALCVDCICGNGSVDMMMLEVMPSLSCLLIVRSQLCDCENIRPLIAAVAGSSLVPVSLNVSSAAGWTGYPHPHLLLMLLLLLVLLLTAVTVTGIVIRLRNIRKILKMGTVWSNVSLATDAVYMILLQFLCLSYMVVRVVFPNCSDVTAALFPFLLGLMLAALVIREADDVLFVFWRNQERRIVESMKVTKVETALDPSGIDDVYQDIYERVVTYFEAEKPFLDSELTINDLVKVLYSNKLYISRAISQFTGRNFCQFVNYYRVTYSMEMFRDNLDLKIHDLATGSGFNSDVSYNMAFRLFMGETPGEWCRKERSRKLKTKK